MVSQRLDSLSVGRGDCCFADLRGRRNDEIPSKKPTVSFRQRGNRRPSHATPKRKRPHGAELQVTEKIQRLVMPSQEELEAVGNLDIAGYEVGGDYYDVLQRDGRLKIAIGDITGHGVEAGMVMLLKDNRYS